MNIIRPTLIDDVEALVPNLRDMDIHECRSVSNAPVADTLRYSVEASVQCYTWLNNDRVVAVFGCAPKTLCPGVGIPWMMGTDEVAVEREFLFDRAPHFIAMFEQQFSTLENYCSADNHVCIKWLRRSGFQFHDKVLSPTGAEFLRFTKDQ